MTPPKFFSRFSKKLKYRLAGDGQKPGGSGTDVAGLSVDLENKGGDDEGNVDLMGLPPRPGNPGAASEDERKPEIGQSRTDVDEGAVGSMDLSPLLSGEEVPGTGDRREGNGAIVEGEVALAIPPLRSDLGIPLGDQRPSGGM